MIFVSAKEGNTNVTINDGTAHSADTLTNAGDHMDVMVTHTAERAITSTKPVMVTSFSSQEIGDPTMYFCDAALLSLVPKDQYMTRYFLAQDVQEPTSTWAVVKNGEQGNLAGGSLTWTWEAAAIDGTYLTGSASVGDPLLEVSHVSEGFALYQHGSGGEGLSAFVSGIKLCTIAVTNEPGDGHDSDCDGRIDKESSATSDDDNDGEVGEDRAIMAAVETTTESENLPADSGNSTPSIITEEMTTTPKPTEDDEGGSDKWYTNKTVIVMAGCVAGAFLIIALYVAYKMCFPDDEVKKVNPVRTMAPKLTKVVGGKFEEIEVEDYAPMDMPRHNTLRNNYVGIRNNNRPSRRSSDMATVYN